MGFELADAPLKPKAALVDARNRFVRYLAEAPSTRTEDAATMVFS